jgi:hypothetical protein
MAALIAGAVSLTLSRALTTNGGDAADQLAQLSGHQTQMIVSILLAVLGFALLIPGYLTVAGMVGERGGLLATIGAGLTVVGCTGFAVLASVDVPAVAATYVPDRDAMITFIERLNESAALGVVGPLAMLGLFFGPFLVLLGARRAGIVRAWLPWASLAVWVLQPVSTALSGPSTLNRLIATVCQLALVVVAAFVTRAVLAARRA